MQSKEDAKEEAKSEVSRKILHKGLDNEARSKIILRYVLLLAIF